MLDSEFLKIVAEKAGPGALIAVVAIYFIWRMAVSHAKSTATMVESQQSAISLMVESHNATTEKMARSFEDRLEKTHQAHEARLAELLSDYKQISTKATAVMAVFNENIDRLEVRQ